MLKCCLTSSDYFVHMLNLSLYIPKRAVHKFSGMVVPLYRLLLFLVLPNWGVVEGKCIRGHSDSSWFPVPGIFRLSDLEPFLPHWSGCCSCWWLARWLRPLSSRKYWQPAGLNVKCVSLTDMVAAEKWTYKNLLLYGITSWEGGVWSGWLLKWHWLDADFLYHVPFLSLGLQ